MDIKSITTNSSVYRIYNKDDGKSYVGSSTNPRMRIDSHFRMLRKGNHHCKLLQEAYNQQGESGFSIDVEPRDWEELLLREKDLLEEYRGKGLCYNASEVKVTTKDRRKKRIAGDKAIASYYLPTEISTWIEQKAMADNRSPSNFLATLIKNMPDFQS